MNSAAEPATEQPAWAPAPAEDSAAAASLLDLQGVNRLRVPGGRESQIDQLLAYDAQIAQLLTGGACSGAQAYAVAKTLSCLSAARMRPSPLCQERVAAWIVRGGFASSLAGASSARWCVKSLMYAWARFATQPDSVAMRTLPAVMAALQRGLAAQGEADHEVAVHAHAALSPMILSGMHSVQGVQAAMAAVRPEHWNVYCSLTAMSALSKMCARSPPVWLPLAMAGMQRRHKLPDAYQVHVRRRTAPKQPRAGPGAVAPS